jgi:hypothetical protein
VAVRIIPRSEWRARYDRGFAAAELPVSRVWLHHTAMTAPPVDASADRDASECRIIERVGEDRFGGGISYTFVVMPSGRVFEGHGIDRRGAHTGGQNSTSRAIVLHGNYTSTRPTPQQQDAVAELLRLGVASGWWTSARLAGGHRDAPNASTECPGDAAYAMIGHLNQLAAGTLVRPAPRPGTGTPPMTGAPELDANERATLDNIARGVSLMKPGQALPARSGNCRAEADDEFGATLHAWAEAADGRALGEQLVEGLGQLLDLVHAQGERINRLESRLALAGGADPQAFADQVSSAIARKLAG